MLLFANISLGSVLRCCILLGTCVELMPHQPQLKRASPLLKCLSSRSLSNLLRLLLFQMITRRAVQIVMQIRRDVFSISAVIPSTPDVSPFFNLFAAVFTSFGSSFGSALTSISKECQFDYGP